MWLNLLYRHTINTQEILIKINKAESNLTSNYETLFKNLWYVDASHSFSVSEDFTNFSFLVISFFVEGKVTAHP